MNIMVKVVNQRKVNEMWVNVFKVWSNGDCYCKATQVIKKTNTPMTIDEMKSIGRTTILIPNDK